MPQHGVIIQLLEYLLMSHRQPVGTSNKAGWITIAGPSMPREQVNRFHRRAWFTGGCETRIGPLFIRRRIRLEQTPMVANHAFPIRPLLQLRRPFTERKQLDSQAASSHCFTRVWLASSIELGKYIRIEQEPRILQ